VSELAISAVQRVDFETFVRKAFLGEKVEGLDDAVTSLRSLLSNVDEEGRVSITEADLVVFASLAALISDGFDLADDRTRSLQYLNDLRMRSAVFIDEVQDFTEMQVFLMGMTVSHEYNQITLSGDMCQKLHKNGLSDYSRALPLVPRRRRNSSVFLDINFRQRDCLARLSAGFRTFLQKDTRIRDEYSDPLMPARVHVFENPDEISETIVLRIRKLPLHATTAVILPTLDEANKWYDLLGEELAEYGRKARLSERDDLNRRYDVHFTSSLETKGLEFDAVVVPNIGSFAIDTEIGRNQMYVAISRAKHALFVGCAASESKNPAIKFLAASGLIRCIAVK